MLGTLLADARHDPVDPFAAERFLDGRLPVPEPMTINLAEHLRPPAPQE